jgi:adenylate cyclase class 2
MREVEIKYRIGELERFREKLSSIGRLKEVRLFEDNIVFDDERGTLFGNGRLLRLRSSAAVLLTFKNPVQKERYKIMDEHEVAVSDFNETLNILLGLGYRQVFRYQKYRTAYRVDAALVLLDETPIGDFIEIEGPPRLIDRVSGQLGLQREEGITENYLELYREHVRACGGDPTAMLFRAQGT